MAEYEIKQVKHHITFQIEVTTDRDWMEDGIHIVVSVACDTPNPHYGAIMSAAEHMMSMAATFSKVSFDEALELLCKGARSNHLLEYRGVKPQ